MFRSANIARKKKIWILAQNLLWWCLLPVFHDLYYVLCITLSRFFSKLKTCPCLETRSKTMKALALAWAVLREVIRISSKEDLCIRQLPRWAGWGTRAGELWLGCCQLIGSACAVPGRSPVGPEQLQLRDWGAHNVGRSLHTSAAAGVELGQMSLQEEPENKLSNIFRNTSTTVTK